MTALTVSRLKGRPFYGQAMGHFRLTCTFSAECAQTEGCGIAAFGGDEYIVSVTGFSFVPSVLHDEEAITKAPSLPGPVLSFISVRLSVCG